jgi:transcription regulator MmyB-like protein
MSVPWTHPSSVSRAPPSIASCRATRRIPRWPWTGTGICWRPTGNVLRLSLHPDGLASRILNLPEWREHLLVRLAHDVERSADPVLAALLDELKHYPVPAGPRAPPINQTSIAVPLSLASPDGPLSFISTTTVFGTAVDVTLAELTIETFFPADAATAAAMAASRSTIAGCEQPLRP